MTKKKLKLNHGKNQKKHKSSRPHQLIPSANASILVTLLRDIPPDKLETIWDHINMINDNILSGDLKYIEAMLLNQAHVLNAMFYSHTTKMQTSKYLDTSQAHCEIALKAQKQCRATLTALADLKSPRPTAFIKQQNNAINQQVNNLGEKANNLEENKKNFGTNNLEIKPYDHLDTRETLTAVTDHSSVATMEKINGR